MSRKWCREWHKNVNTIVWSGLREGSAHLLGLALLFVIPDAVYILLKVLCVHKCHATTPSVFYDGECFKRYFNKKTLLVLVFSFSRVSHGNITRKHITKVTDLDG